MVTGIEFALAIHRPEVPLDGHRRVADPSQTWRVTVSASVHAGRAERRTIGGRRPGATRPGGSNRSSNASTPRRSAPVPASPPPVPPGPPPEAATTEVVREAASLVGVGSDVAEDTTAAFVIEEAWVGAVTTTLMSGAVTPSRAPAGCT